MEFPKNYSDDSLMCQNDGGQLVEGSHTTSADLADYELPPYSGSSCGISGESAPNQQLQSTSQQATPVRVVAVAGQLALDGDDGSASSNVSTSRLVGQSPALLETEAYADSLAREILNDTDELVRLRTEPPQQEKGEEEKGEEEKGEERENTGPLIENISPVRENISPVEEPESTVSKPESTVSKPESRVSEPESTVSKPESTVSEPEQPAMEFTKNYSDDLLMGQNDGGQSGEGQGESHTTIADLADYELPPYSGSSSGSSGESAPKQQQSPTTSNNKNKAQSSAPSATSSQSSGLSPPSLTALRDLLKSNYSRVSHIFHWRKPIESGVCFAIGVTLIIALTFFSIISVVAYSTLGLMLASGSIRLYKTVMKTLNRSTDLPVDHIWNNVQALNVSITHEKMHELVDSSLGNFNASLNYFKQVLLVEDKIATLKFGAFIYFLTYIGAWFNGMTLITIGYLALFTVPILYEKNKTKIDELLNLATSHLCSATSMITNKVGSLVSGSSSATAAATKKQD